MLDRIRIVLVNTSHPGNIGAAARAMKVMGLSKLYLVAPNEDDPHQALGRAAGAMDLLSNAVTVQTLPEALQGCVWVAGASARRRNVKWPELEPHECVETCKQKIEQGDVAIVFGRERTGLSNEELELCNALVCIPANPDYSSLNIAAAVQVLCYECRIAMVGGNEPYEGKTLADDVLASNDQLDDMYEHLLQMLGDVGFVGTSNPEIVMRRLKGLFNRAQPTKREVNILRGIFSAAQGRKSARKP